MTARASFDPWVELARIRAREMSLPQVVQTAGVGAPSGGTDVPEEAIFATFATFAIGDGETRILRDPAEWDAGDWRETFAERLAVLMIDGEQTEAEARRIAFEHCVIRWLSLHEIRSDPGHCAGCGEADKRGSIISYHSGGGAVWLHPRCWRDWSKRRRQQAIAELRPSGIMARIGGFGG